MNATMKLTNGDFVGVMYSSALHHAKEPREGYFQDGKLSVGGCVAGSAGMVGDIITLPYHHVGGDEWTMKHGDTVAILANGVHVTLGNNDRGVSDYEADGKTYRSILAAAMDITPAK